MAAFVCFNCTVNAQIAKKLVQEERVIVDSIGTQYPYAIWKKFVATKEYRLKKIDKNTESNAYMLVTLDAAHIERRVADLPKPKESDNFTDGQQIDLFSCKLTGRGGCVLVM